MSLFKYYPPERVTFLKTLLLRYSPPLSFNDPFDCIPAIINFDSDAMSQKRYDDWQWDKYQEWLGEKPPHPPTTFPEYKKSLPPFSVWQRLTKEVLPKARDGFDAHYRGMLRNLGVLCLCKNGHSPAMWAHYAKEHTGFLVEFDDEHSFFADVKNGHFLEVEYVSDRPAWDFGKQQGPADLFKFKSVEWAYEQEVRFLALYSERPDFLPDNRGEKTMVPIPPEAVLGVTIGYRADASTVAELTAHLGRSDLKHVRHSYSAPDRDLFHINREAGWLNTPNDGASEWQQRMASC